jgi:hypothetical protein
MIFERDLFTRVSSVTPPISVQGYNLCALP